MATISLDAKKMLGFRLLDSVDCSNDGSVLAGKSGKQTEPLIANQVALSAKFGKPGKIQRPG